MNQPPTIPPGPPAFGLRPHRGSTVLVLGILSLVISGCGIGLILGILAWTMGNTDLTEMDSGRMDPTGRSMTQAGKICGMISVLLSALAVVIGIVYFVIIGMLFAGAAAAGHP